MDILNIILIIILLLLFPLGQLFRIDLGNSTAINPLDIGVGIASCITLGLLLIKKKTMQKQYIIIGLFSLVGFIGLFVNISHLNPKDFFVSLLYLIRFILYASVGLSILLLSKRQKDVLMYILTISGGIVLVAGFVQYLLFPSLWSLIYEGWDPHLYRMFSTFFDPNFAGVFFVLYFLLVFHLFFEYQTLKWKILYGSLALFSFIAVIMSLSRGAYVVLGISVILYLFFKGYKKIAIGMPLIILALAAITSFFIPYGEGKNLFRTASTDARIISDENATQIFLKNPLVGVGFNSYRYAQYRYQLLEGLQWQESHSGAGTNNSFLFVLATTGLVGGVLFAYFWFIVLQHSLSAIRTKEKHALLFFVSFVALLVSGLFENTLFYPSLMLWMWILVGLAIE